MPNANQERALPPTMEAAFDSVVNAFGAILAPGARNKLYQQTMNAYLGGEITSSDPLTAKLTGFLLGDDYRAALDADDKEAARVADPSRDAL